EEIHKAFYTDECVLEEDELYYNLWIDQNLAAYLIESLESHQEPKILFAIYNEFSSNRQQQAQDLLQKNIKVFAEKISKMEQMVRLGYTSLIQHEINTEEISAIEKQEIIKPIKSRWTSPVVLVPKKKEFVLII
ncbi:24135_t:CDS:2, partial [Racocetra persica]